MEANIVKDKTFANATSFWPSLDEIKEERGIHRRFMDHTGHYPWGAYEGTQGNVPSTRSRNDTCCRNSNRRPRELFVHVHIKSAFIKWENTLNRKFAQFCNKLYPSFFRGFDISPVRNLGKDGMDEEKKLEKTTYENRNYTFVGII